MNRYFAAVALSLAASAAHSQDYPYEDASKGRASRKGLPEETAPVDEEIHDAAPASPGHAGLPALFRIGLKAGLEYSFFQPIPGTPTTNSVTETGIGFDGLVSFGWDLPYQPIFLEAESGYQGLLANSGQILNIIPLRLGVFRRFRTGARSLIKVGLVPSMDVRIVNEGATGSQVTAVPSLAAALVVESGGFLAQPEFRLYRIGSNANFFSFALLAGFRF